MKLPTFSSVLPKGSVLVFSLIILSIMLVTSLTLLSSAVLDRKASLSTANSTRSFQVADAGAEQVLQQIYKGTGIDTIGDINIDGTSSCSLGGVIESSDGWKIRFYDEDGNRITDCTTDMDEVASIKSEGSANGTVRAVEVAVAQAAEEVHTFDERLSSGGEVTGLKPGKKYHMIVMAQRSGRDSRSTPTASIYDCDGHLLVSKNLFGVGVSDENFSVPFTWSFIVTAPDDGCIESRLSTATSSHAITGFSLE